MVAALGAAGVRVVLFKGAALAYTHYPAPHLRVRADTDLLVTAEDHYIEGGLGSAVAEVLAEAGSGTPLRRLAVSRVPGSAPVGTLMSAHGLDAEGIVATTQAAMGVRART